jgi:hypothetical protein
MKKIIIASLLLSTFVFAELTPKDRRALLRQPYTGIDPCSVVRAYDGWKIRGDIFFYNRIVKHLKIIEKGSPHMYAVGQRGVKSIIHNRDPKVNNTGARAWPSAASIAIGDRSINHWSASDVTDSLLHEFKHCDTHGTGEGAAQWTAVVYGRKCGIHPTLIRYRRGMGLNLGYSQAKWDSDFKKTR